MYLCIFVFSYFCNFVFLINSGVRLAPSYLSVREVDEEGSGSARCDLFLFCLFVKISCGCSVLFRVLYNSLLACNILEVFFDTQFPDSPHIILLLLTVLKRFCRKGPRESIGNKKGLFQ